MWRLLQCEVISGYSVLFHSLVSMSVLYRSYSSLDFYGAFVPLLVWVPLPVLFGDSVIEQPSPRFRISSSTRGGKQTVLASVRTAVAAVRKENSCLGMACSFRGLLHCHHGRENAGEGTESSAFRSEEAGGETLDEAWAFATPAPPVTTLPPPRPHLLILLK